MFSSWQTVHEDLLSKEILSILHSPRKITTPSQKTSPTDEFTTPPPTSPLSVKAQHSKH